MKVLKKMKPFFLLLLVLGLANTASQAQSFFEGTLEFKVELSGPGAQAIKANKPNNKMFMHLKDDNYIVHLMGGEYPKTFMFIADSNYEYSVDMESKRAFKYSPYRFATKNRARGNEKVTATGQTEMVNDIECEIYEMKKEGMHFRFYVNDDYRINTSLYKEKTRAKAYFLIDGMDGRVPLKVIKKTPQITSITTLTKATQRKFDAFQFSIPPDFIIKKRDYRY